MSEVTLTVTDAPSDAELAAISEGLAAYNESQVGPAHFSMLTVILRDDADEIAGGIYGYTHWGWLYVQRLWLAESRRGQGLAGRMLDAAEAEARRRGCHGAWIDTFNPVALKVYERQGYTPFGALADFPSGGTRTFLQKRLA